MIILDEQEGYTQQSLQHILPLFSRCGFKGIITHGLLDMPTYGRSIREIDLAVIGSNDLGVFQPNIAYFHCEFNIPASGIGPKPEWLQSYNSQSPPYMAKVEIGRYSTVGLKEFPWTSSVHKDLVFLNKNSQLELGWYNKYHNILWAIDLGNYEDTAASNLEIILKLILGFNEGRMPHNKITIGTDPEFEIIGSDGTLIDACTVFDDPERVNQIGIDGHAATGELRPPFANNPLKLARNIKRLIRKIDNNPNLDFPHQIYAGGGTQVMTGGHLHFGITKLDERLRDLLWDYVTAPVLKCQGQLRREDRSKSTRNGGDIFRSQPHGIEYRPLPSFIINEEITKSVLCTAYAFVKSYYNGGIPDPIDRRTIYRKLSTYSAYADEIETFIRLFVSPPETSAKELTHRDIIKEWKLTKLSRQNTITVNSDYVELGTKLHPLSIKLSNKIRFGVYRSLDNIMYLEHIPDEALSLWEAFASKHFIEYVIGAPKSKRQSVANTMTIYLPNFWQVQKYSTAIYGELKHLIKETILIYSQKDKKGG